MAPAKPAPAPARDALRCPSCRTMLVPVDPDDAAVFGLPSALCAHRVEELVAAVTAQGWRAVDNAARSPLVAAKFPTRTYLASYAARSPDKGGSMLMFGSYAPAWVWSVLDDWEIASSAKVVALRHAAKDPELATAVWTVFRAAPPRQGFSLDQNPVAKLLLGVLVPQDVAPQDSTDDPPGR